LALAVSRLRWSCRVLASGAVRRLPEACFARPNRSRRSDAGTINGPKIPDNLAQRDRTVKGTVVFMSQRGGIANISPRPDRQSRGLSRSPAGGRVPAIPIRTTDPMRMADGRSQETAAPSARGRSAPTTIPVKTGPGWYLEGGACSRSAQGHGFRGGPFLSREEAIRRRCRLRGF
jgi:hypothetical protein